MTNYLISVEQSCASNKADHLDQNSPISGVCDGFFLETEKQEAWYRSLEKKVWIFYWGQGLTYKYTQRGLL